MLKLGVLATWAVVIWNLFMPLPGVWQTVSHWVGLLMLVAHVVEYFVLAKKVQAKGDGALKSFLMTLVFGLTYIMD